MRKLIRIISKPFSWLVPQRVRRELTRPVGNNKGIAILIAVASIIVITYFAMEVTYDSNIEYIVNSQGLSRLKSYYAAKAGLSIALLRIKVYQKVSSQYGKQLGANASMLDEIWRFPFAWPLPVPPEVNAVDKDAIQEMVKASTMDSSYLVTIEDEGSKIDLNDLNSASKALRDNAKSQLAAIFAARVKNDEEFSRKYSGFRFDELINSIQDWMTSTSKSDNGTDKRQAYGELNSRAGTSDYFPPNRAFRTLEELHMVPQMTDDFYSLLEPAVTIYGMKGINPNIAVKKVIQSLNTGITDEVADELIKRRDDQNLGGPYKNADDFWNYATSRGARLEGDYSKTPLVFENIMNFRIRSTGEYGGVSREITAIVMDISQTAGKIKGLVDKEAKANNPVSNANNPNGAAAKTDAPTQSDANLKGPPRIVFWSEK